jgi:hypothetical protein
MRRAALAALAIFLAAGALSAQQISNLEAGRPVSIEDAIPVARGAFSLSVDYAGARRFDGVHYAGPAVALLYGFAPGFEAGAQTRWVTNPRLNASRGIGSGDVDLHVLGSVADEAPRMPAVAVRADVLLPTGIASHGTNASLEALFTKSFARVRVHANFSALYVGDTRRAERRNRVAAILGADAPLPGPWNTDTLLLADVVFRQSVLHGDQPTVGFELGVRRRIGVQTLFYAGVSSDVVGEEGRLRYRGLFGVTHAF